jgi:hypothetical protein
MKLDKIFSLAILLVGAILINELVIKIPSLRFGKDNGFIFRFLSTCFLSSTLFFIHKRKVRQLFVGCFVGIFGCLIVFSVLFILSILVYKDNRGWDMPAVYYQLLISLVIFFLFHMVSRLGDSGGSRR